MTEIGAGNLGQGVAERGIVHIVDDDADIRDSLAWLFSSRGLTSRQWASGEEFLAAMPLEDVACVVLDVRMEGIGGVEVFQRLRTVDTVVPVIFLTGHGEVPMAVDMMKQGAADYFEKPFNDNKLADLVIAELVRCAERRQASHRNEDVERRFASLSARELEVLPLLRKGWMNKQIAGALGVADRTVEVHRANILHKMGARNAAHLGTILALVGIDENTGE
jgi:two-component system, LuxR family, response regulator DctR